MLGVYSRSWLATIRLELADSAKVEFTDGKWTVNDEWSFSLPPGAVLSALMDIKKGGINLDKLVELQDLESGPLRVTEQIGRLWHRGMLVERLYYRGEAAAVLHNYGEMVPLIPENVTPDEELTFSEDCCIRFDNRNLIIESLEYGALLIISNTELSKFPMAMTQPMNCRDWARELSVPVEVVLAAGCCLKNIGALKQPCAASIRNSSPGWSFADQMMHARSRYGRHIGGYGGTFPLKNRLPVPPVLPEITTSCHKRLPIPDMDDIIHRDPPFSEVLETRHSCREHGQAPLKVDRLGEFLYRTSRVTERRGTGPHEVAFRPYPSGGALYELEVYPLLNRCTGLPEALYEYEASTHSLSHIAEPSAHTRRLIDGARGTCRMSGEPHVLLLITARFLRVGWKYESIAYSLILKNVGVLFQTMYLVATAMGLGACAIGGGNSDLFCRVTGKEFWEESTVGEFILGEK